MESAILKSYRFYFPKCKVSVWFKLFAIRGISLRVLRVGRILEGAVGVQEYRVFQLKLCFFVPMLQTSIFVLDKNNSFFYCHNNKWDNSLVINNHIIIHIRCSKRSHFLWHIIFFGKNPFFFWKFFFPFSFKSPFWFFGL